MTTVAISASDSEAFAPSQNGLTAGVVPRWSAGSRIAFRFFFLLTLLYSIVTLGVEVVYRLPFALRLGVWWSSTVIEPIWSPIVRWIARNVLRVTISGPVSAQWVGLFCVAMLSALGTLGWTIVDRRRLQYHSLYDWLRVYCRFAAAVLLMSYGLEKVLITQADFPPAPSALLKPLGSFDPASFFFAYLAASPAYQAFAGSVELLAGILLIPRRTTAIGALLAVGAMANVLVVNWAFDIRMYRISLSTFIIAVFLLLPDLPRLANVLVLNRTVLPAKARWLFDAPRLNKLAQILGVCFLIGEIAFLLRRDMTEGMHWRGRPPLYGAYVVQDFVRSGARATSPATDDGRWTQLAVDSKPTGNLMPVDAFGVIVRPRDTMQVMIRVDTAHRVVTFMQGKQTSQWTYTTPDTNHLVLTRVDHFRPAGMSLALKSPSRTVARDTANSTASGASDSLRVTLRRLDLMAFRLFRGK